MQPHTHHKKSPLRRQFSAAIHAALLTSFASSVTVGAATTAYAEESQVFDFQLPAGKLEDALNALAKQSAITLTFDAAQVKGKSVPALKK
jgi:iron complex outermembrane receptor protein